MFLKNSWYCAGWDHEVTQAKHSVIPRKIAGEYVVLYRQLNGAVVALEDRCPHRQAPLSLGRKEGNSLRCMYHGMLFEPSGKCTEVPAVSKIPERACVRSFPVVEKNNWVWIWMGDPAKADEALIPHSLGPSSTVCNVRTSKMRVQTNYRNEIANLADLSHITWVHETTVGGSRKYTEVVPHFQLKARSLHTKYWVRSVPVAAAAQHLFPEGTLFDLLFDIEHTLPCTWVLNYRVHFAGSATEGDSDGQMVLDTWTSQAVTPRDEDSVDYYYAWGATKETDAPGLADMLRESLDIAFKEDAVFLEAQQERMRHKPDYKMVDLPLDEGPGKLLWLLDKLLKEEANGDRSFFR